MESYWFLLQSASRRILEIFCAEASISGDIPSPKSVCLGCISNSAIFALVICEMYSQKILSGSIWVENAGEEVNFSGSISLESPGFSSRIAASIRRTCVGSKSIICCMKLSGTVSHSINKTFSEVFPFKYPMTLTPTKSSLRIGFPMPARTTFREWENQFFSSSWMPYLRALRGTKKSP